MYFIDVQGTLISDADKSPIRGSKEFVSYLNEHQIPYMVVTNNTKKGSSDFFGFLKGLGFELKEGAYLDPIMLLEKEVTAKRIAAYGDEAFLEVLRSKGYLLDFEKPEYVLIGVKKDFTSDIFAEIIDFLLGGAKLIGMHETTLYAKDGKRYPGTGAILQMLKAATFAEYKVVGKPSIPFYDLAKKMLGEGVDYRDITMISDDVKGDLVGAKALGMKTIFVLSGKYSKAEEIIPHIDKAMQPDEILADMAEVLEYIKGER